MDFVFGKLINDELKLTYHRASRHGVQPPAPDHAGRPVAVRRGDGASRHFR